MLEQRGNSFDPAAKKTPVFPSHRLQKLTRLIRKDRSAQRRSADTGNRVFSEIERGQQALPKDHASKSLRPVREEHTLGDASADPKEPNSIRTVKIVSALLMADGLVTCFASSPEYGGGSNVGDATGGVLLLTGFLGFIAGRYMA
jgi:hypothetical protein